MAKTDKQLLAALRAIEQAPDISDRDNNLSEALASPNNRVVGRAAKLVGQLQLEGFERELRDAYQRFLDNPLKSDPGCEAKTPLCEALRQLEHDDADFFLAGIRYEQREPIFSQTPKKYVDTAATIRAICGFALIQLNDSRALSELVDLLGDPEKTARAGAARAIAHAGGQTSELLLRLKIDLGDPEPEVLGECFAGLLQLDSEGGIARVAKFLLHSSEAVCCEAALALGETRSIEAFQFLKTQAELRHGRDYENVLLTSLGLLGLPQSIDYLLQIVIGSDVGSTIAAIRALRLCRDPLSFGQRLRQAVDQSENPQIRHAFNEEFPDYFL